MWSSTPGRCLPIAIAPGVGGALVIACWWVSGLTLAGFVVVVIPREVLEEQGRQGIKKSASGHRTAAVVPP